MNTVFNYEDEEFTPESITLEKVNELTEKSLNIIIDSLVDFANEEITRKMIKNARMGCTMLEYEVKWQGFPEFDELSDEVKEYRISLAVEKIIKFWKDKNFKIHDNPDLADEVITIIWGKENKMIKENKSEQEIIDDIVNYNIEVCDDIINKAKSEGKHECVYTIDWPNNPEIDIKQNMAMREAGYDQFLKYYTNKNYSIKLPDEEYYLIISW